MKKFMTQWTMLCVLVGLCATAQEVTLAEAIDMPGATITTSGSGWEATTDRAQTGGYGEGRHQRLLFDRSEQMNVRCSVN